MSAGRVRPGVQRVAYNKTEAALALGVELSTFERHFYPDLKKIRRGNVVLITHKELERLAERLEDYDL